jgi:ribonuclease P protein component
MLPRSDRLSVEQFNTVMEKGRVINSSLFLLRTISVDERTRISAVVPKKVAKTATARNYLRRKMYEAIKPFISEVAKNTHTIVFAKTGAGTVEFADLAKEIKNSFVKAKLLG